MKVNPVSIQSYQQVARREQPAQPQVKSEQDGSVKNSVAIEPQKNLTGSKLAVKAPSGSYADYLSAEEKQALEVLFNKFQDNSRFGSGYRANADNAKPEATVGRIIDVKV